MSKSTLRETFRNALEGKEHTDDRMNLIDAERALFTRRAGIVCFGSFGLAASVQLLVSGTGPIVHDRSVMTLAFSGSLMLIFGAVFAFITALPSVRGRIGGATYDALLQKVRNDAVKDPNGKTCRTPAEQAFLDSPFGLAQRVVDETRIFVDHARAAYNRVSSLLGNTPKYTHDRDLDTDPRTARCAAAIADATRDLDLVERELEALWQSPSVEVYMRLHSLNVANACANIMTGLIVFYPTLIFRLSIRHAS